jgi:hypothetical protein
MVWIGGRGVNVGEQQLNQVIDRLDQVKLELLRLRAILVPVEELTPEEREELELSREEVKRGKCVTLEDVLEELG